MLIHALCFYLFAAILIASAVMVIAARNPVHSVLFLILGFFNAAGLFVLMGAEFLAMILVVVYVGAVAVLFLFVVMMLDINFARLREGFLRYLPIGGAVGLVLLAELVLVATAWVDASASASLRAATGGRIGTRPSDCFARAKLRAPRSRCTASASTPSGSCSELAERRSTARHRACALPRVMSSRRSTHSASRFT